MIEVKPIDPFNAQVQALVEELDALQSSLYDEQSNHFDSSNELARSNVHFLAVIEADELLGCGAVKILDEGENGPRYGEIKRMFVSPKARGKGAGKALMAELESRALADGASAMRLETGIYQPEAIGLYERFGYSRREPFGDYGPDPVSVFMEKPLAR